MKSFFNRRFHIYKYQINIKSLFDKFTWAHIYARIYFKSKKADVYSINMDSSIVRPMRTWPREIVFQ